MSTSAVKQSRCPTMMSGPRICIEGQPSRRRPLEEEKTTKPHSSGRGRHPAVTHLLKEGGASLCRRPFPMGRHESSRAEGAALTASGAQMRGILSFLAPAQARGKAKRRSPVVPKNLRRQQRGPFFPWPAGDQKSQPVQSSPATAAATNFPRSPQVGPLSHPPSAHRPRFKLDPPTGVSSSTQDIYYPSRFRPRVAKPIFKMAEVEKIYVTYNDVSPIPVVHPAQAVSRPRGASATRSPLHAGARDMLQPAVLPLLRTTAGGSR